MRKSKPTSTDHSSEKRMARSVARVDKTKQRATHSDLDEILGHFCDALAIAETAYDALNTLQEDGRPIGAAVVTLGRGLSELRRTYTDLDLAIPQLR